MYGPVRTVVWQGTAGNRCPYADQTGLSECGERSAEYFVLSDDASGRCNQNLSGGGFNFGENEHSQPAAVNAD